jgi:hypothetical protein
MNKQFLVLVGVVSVFAVACGGKSGDETSPPGVNAPGGCTQGAPSPCSCADGSAGTKTCQLDGTMSLCESCGAAKPGPGSTPGTTGTAGSGAMTTPDPGMAMTDPGMPAVPDKAGVVTVSPEDVAACSGTGTPPMANEVVEVLKIRTSDVVPGGYKAAGGTVYACFWAEIDMPEKHHIIGWEGAVGGDRLVHHQQVSLSQKPFYLAAFGQGGLCGLPTIDYTWTGERPTEWTPKLAGYPVGGPENKGKAYFTWQTHFEGVTTYSGGFNVYITKNLRKYDAGNFEQGDVAGIKIPAMGAATHESTCTPEMTTQKLVHPIYVYSSMMHAHLTVTHIKGQQFRDNMPMFTFGDMTVGGFAGFFDQSFKPHTPCVEIKPGDKLVTNCDYKNPFPFEVVGGEATNQEMCATFMQYFPRLPGTSNNFCGTIDATGGLGM